MLTGFDGKVTRNENLRETQIGASIILKWISEKWDWNGGGNELVVGPCKHGNEASGSIKYQEILECFSMRTHLCGVRLVQALHEPIAYKKSTCS
jgi:hypothetical protein